MSKPLGRRFLGLTAVNLAASLTVPLAGVVDTAMLGRLPTIGPLAGVALAALIFDYLYFGCGFLRMGTTGTTAQARGRGDREEVLCWLLRAGALAVALGAAILLAAPLIERFSFALLAGGPEVEQQGRAYFRARIWGAPATLLNLAMVGWLLGRERSGRVLAVTAVGNAANVLLDWLFILRLGWGAPGAGAATALSQYAASVTALLLLGLSPTALAGSWRRALRLDRVLSLARLNADIFVRTLCLISAFACFTSFSARLGAATLAANALLMRLLDVASYGVDGAAYAVEALAGAFEGGGDRRSLGRLLALAVLTGVALGAVVAIPVLLAPRAILGLLTTHGELVAGAEPYAGWLALVILVGSIAYILDGFFLGLTAGAVLRNAMFAAAAIFLPLALLALERRSNLLLWASLALLMAGRVATLGVALPARLRR